MPGYDDWYIGAGSEVEMFIIGIDGEYSMLSVGAEGNEAGERTERRCSESRRIVVLAAALMMITTPTSLSDDIKNLKTRWGKNHSCTVLRVI